MGPVEWKTHNRTVPCSGCVLASKDNKIAAGGKDCITILDATTGSQKATFSGHTGNICALTFSVDGTLLVSGSCNRIIKLWDVQTGGVIKTFNCVASVTSVSISADNTTIAIGSLDNAIRLWNIETGDTFSIKCLGGRNCPVVCFSPKNSQLLLSTYDSRNTMWWWGTNGYCIGPPIPSDDIKFSSDGTQFASSHKNILTVQDTDSGKLVTQFHTYNHLKTFCFSSNGKFIACIADHIYLWDIANSCFLNLPETFLDSFNYSTRTTVFLFSHTLITHANNEIKFWDINHLLSAPNIPGTESMAFIATPIVVVSMQSKDGLAFSIDKGGVVKIWDISTGYCKKTIQTQAKDLKGGDMQLINGKLILVGGTKSDVKIWDIEEGGCLTTISTSSEDVRISGDGSKLFSLGYNYGPCINVWSTWTGELISQARLGKDFFSFYPLKMDGSKVPVYLFDDSIQAWDFGTQGSGPIQLPVTFLDNLCVKFNWNGDTGMEILGVEIQGRVTKGSFPLLSEYTHPSVAQCSCHYMILGYKSGEVLILDLDHTPHLEW